MQLKEHTLNRLGYGIGAWQSSRYDQLGHAAYVQEQIQRSLPEIAIDDVFIESKIARGAIEYRQLEAVLLDFWFNHFNVNAKNNKPTGRSNNGIGATLPEYQNIAIGGHVLGNFGDMLLAIAKSAAMLTYLDNQTNRKPRVLESGKVHGYNENYARELLELHTLGINGGYSESDIQDVAKILTGWRHSWSSGTPPYSFDFSEWSHDTSEKRVMGRVYPAGRYIEEGEELLGFLADHGATANFISAKLCNRFVGDNPPAAAIAAVAQTFKDTGGDLAAVMTTLLTGPAFTSPDESQFRSKAKPPHRFVTSALMAMGATDRALWSSIESVLADGVINAGDTPYFFAPPTGYPEAAGYWLSPSSMLGRFDLATTIAYEPSLVASLATHAGVDGSDVAATFDAVRRVVLPSGVSAATEVAVKDHVSANAMTNDERLSATAHMLFCSPEFMRY